MSRALAAILLAAFPAAAGCVANDADANVVILHNQAVGDTCTVSADAGSTFIASGVLDISSPSDWDIGYVFTPVVQNFAAASTGDTNDSLKIAFIEGANVDVHFADSDREAAVPRDDKVRYQVPLSGSITPGGTAGFAFEIVPSVLIPDLVDGDLLLVDVRMVGRMGGGDFSGASFRYPIEVCDGCREIDVGGCAALPIGYSGDVDLNGCNPFQDGVLECCDGGAVCPAKGPSGP